MITKTLLATTALVAASSMAFAGWHGTLPRGQTWQQHQQLRREALLKQMPGVRLDKNNVVIARVFTTTSKNAVGHDAKVLPHGSKVDNFSKSKNALFLSFFGWAVSNRSASNHYSGSYCISYGQNGSCLNYEQYKEQYKDTNQQSRAEPFKGLKSASEITVAAAQQSGTTGGYTVGIYSNHTTTTSQPCGGGGNGYSELSAPSCPTGTALAAGTYSTPPTWTGLCCSALHTVTFSPITLNKKSQYWVVMTAPGTTNTVYWNGQDTNFSTLPPGSLYKYAYSSSYKDTYKTTKSGHSNTAHGSYHTSTKGWVHAISYSVEDTNPAFAVK